MWVYGFYKSVCCLQACKRCTVKHTTASTCACERTMLQQELTALVTPLTSRNVLRSAWSQKEAGMHWL
jgi:hypothetical protein